MAKGGWFAQFDPIVQQYNQSGEQFRIEGHCQSACTLFLGIKNVCIMRSARLLFHAGHDRSRNISASATNHLMSAYNGKLRAYLGREPRHGDARLPYDFRRRHDRQVRLP
jgi:hypothetical protein